MSEEINKAWAEKYRPRTIQDLIFPNQHVVDVVNKWYQIGRITENVLLYGKPGTGKSTLLKILVNDFIKNPKDVFKLGRKVKDTDSLGGWVNASSMDGFKIVVIEEIDRLSEAAFLELKEQYMERYQGKIAFIAATNNVHKVDPAVRTRFNLKISFDDLPLDQLINRMKYVLQQENISYNDEAVKQFVENNAVRGVREMLNLLQIASSSGTFDPSTLSNIGGITEEDNLIKYIRYLLITYDNLPYTSTSVLVKGVLDRNHYEQFGQYYQAMVNIINSFSDIDFDYIFRQLIGDEEIGLDIRQILMKEYQDLPSKIYPYMHFMYAFSRCLTHVNERKRTGA